MKKDFLREAATTSEQRERRRVEEVDFLRRRGLATWEDEAEACRLRRELARRDFRRMVT